MTISFGQNAQLLIKITVSKLQVIDLRPYEETSYHNIVNNLLPKLNIVFDEWYSLLTLLLSHYEKITNKSDGNDEIYNYNDEILDTSPINKLVNTIAIAKWEYEWKKTSLSEKDPKEENTLDLLLLISRLYRSILKTSQAIEQALCDYEELDYDSLFLRVSKQQLEISLEIRRVYTRFSQTVAEENWNNNIELSGQLIKEKLRRIGSAIAVIHGRTIFAQMRVSDRILIKQLQQRIINWLSSSTLEVQTGKAIWQDVCSFAELLVEINNRAELIQHDYTVLCSIYSELSSLPDFIKPLSINLYTKIKTILGRNDYLDQLIQDYEDVSIGQWKKAISNILEQLNSTNTSLYT